MADYTTLIARLPLSGPDLAARRSLLARGLAPDQGESLGGAHIAEATEYEVGVLPLPARLGELRARMVGVAEGNKRLGFSDTVAVGPAEFCCLRCVLDGVPRGFLGDTGERKLCQGRGFFAVAKLAEDIDSVLSGGQCGVVVAGATGGGADVAEDQSGYSWLIDLTARCQRAVQALQCLRQHACVGVGPAEITEDGRLAQLVANPPADIEGLLEACDAVRRIARLLVGDGQVIEQPALSGLIADCASARQAYPERLDPVGPMPTQRTWVPEINGQLPGGLVGAG